MNISKAFQDDKCKNNVDTPSQKNKTSGFEIENPVEITGDIEGYFKEILLNYTKEKAIKFIEYYYSSSQKYEVGDKLLAKSIKATIIKENYEKSIKYTDITGTIIDVSNFLDCYIYTVKFEDFNLTLDESEINKFRIIN